MESMQVHVSNHSNVLEVDAPFDPFSQYDLELAEIENTPEARKALKERTGADCKPPLQLELDSFHSEAREVETKNDPLKWWAKKKQKFPLLAKWARYYLSIPVTSATSERMFSTGGNIMTDNGHNLEPETTSKLFFINKNFMRVQSDIKNWDKTCPSSQDDDLPTPTPLPSSKKRKHPRTPTSSESESSFSNSPPKKKPVIMSDVLKRKKPVDDYSASKSLIDEDDHDDFQMTEESGISQKTVSEKINKERHSKNQTNLGEGTSASAKGFSQPTAPPPQKKHVARKSTTERHDLSSKKRLSANEITELVSQDFSQDDDEPFL
ncbi:uncharacterized protein LOC136079817 [Hydra vulgaris]|uniref:Uncharacterized protein LOC136079817 n=1 Tax=Hydra vulgaris TaxID=6087 RepID=A0ABM4BTH1_HYDVU